VGRPKQIAVFALRRIRRFSFRMVDAGWSTDLRRPFVLVQNAGSMASVDKASAVERALLSQSRAA
jgi:hypothetical protein